MDHILKMHIAIGIFITIISALVVFLGYLTAVSFYMGFEELLLRGDVWFFGYSIFMSVIWGFSAIIVGYQLLYQFLRAYLDERTLKVPEICPECKERLYIEDVKLTEEEKSAECNHCGVEVDVSKGW